ncbi:MAG: oxygen-independent coproporphyrinogen III oxidase [Candidatus Ruthia sp.]|nr:oxygen-independent coproporphyrinogen III oxidase [Candidatus Ruthturnera sp.]MBT4122334.1 oxygen-independent coproporphyrinogen III oxidase [Candidatus Ruthturnera sp.]MBT4668506.1 oxygen-independent coproporphyrinogen III oxidase [Candidatus Ruthturnera sp.]
MSLFESALIKKYDHSGPRYTSYPTANNFAEFSITDYQAQVEISNQNKRTISLYCHIPFCDTVCYYCGCNKVVTKDKNKAEPYLQRLFQEIDLQAELFDQDRTVEQMHFGGGTPTFLSNEQIIRLSEKLQDAFSFADQGEYSIEIDPRGVDEDTIKALAKARFNRISLGVQDFDIDVQKAVNRVQSFEQTKAVIDLSRAHGFESISIDLIYGLPKQSVLSFKATLEKVAELRPDRISLFNYAHLPELFKPQRRINVDELPSADEKLAIFKFSMDFLLDQGYVYIGMDHFALPDDPLAIAQQQGELYRNFQGYSTHAQCDIVGLGLSSIGQVGDSFSQNEKDILRYYAALDEGKLPIIKGQVINEDDKIRRAVIMDLICHFQLDFASIEWGFGIQFKSYFADELSRLSDMHADGLLQLNEDSIQVLDKGKLLIRNICMVFDAYLATSKTQFSKTI